MDLIPSFCAGLSQAIVGHPIDTAKIFIQNNKPLYNLKLRDYYRGFSYPLITSLGFNMIAFPSYNYLNNEFNNSIFSGAIAGIIVSPFVFYVEKLKVARQTNQNINIKNLNIRNLNGFYTTTARETLALGVYFSSYEYMLNRDYNSFISGAFSGVCNWSLTYPLDVIRNRQLYQHISFMKAYKQGGLFKGITITLIRAVLVNGSIFYTYDNTKKWIEN